MPWVVSASDIGVFRHVVMITFVTPSSISMMHAAFSINGTVTGDGDAVATMMTSSSSSRISGGVGAPYSNSDEERVGDGDCVDNGSGDCGRDGDSGDDRGGDDGGGSGGDVIDDVGDGDGDVNDDSRLFGAITASGRWLPMAA